MLKTKPGPFHPSYGFPVGQALLALLLACWCAEASPTPAAAKPIAAKVAALADLQARMLDAQDDMFRWLLEMPALNEHPEEKAQHLLSLRIEHRFKSICELAAEFRRKHSECAELESIETPFRENITHQLEAIRQWEVARNDHPDSAAPWNELAHHLLHSGRVSEALVCLEKSLALLPPEPVYYFDYGTCLLLYRTDAMRHYKLTEPAVFDKVLTIYRRGMKLEPQSFQHAVAFAESYYLITPARPTEGLAAWEHALTLARNPTERSEAVLHLARYAIHRNHANLARIYLEQVTEPRLAPVKTALLRRLADSAKGDKPAAPASPATVAP